MARSFAVGVLLLVFVCSSATSFSPQAIKRTRPSRPSLPHSSTDEVKGIRAVNDVYPAILRSMMGDRSSTALHGSSGGGGGAMFPPRGGGGGRGGGDDNSNGFDPAKSLVALYDSYQRLLTSSPLTTKSISAGLLTLLGDVIAQHLESRVEGYHDWNFVRMGAFTLAGTAFVGPFVHLWYEVLWAAGRRLEARGVVSWGKTLAQVTLDQTVGVAMFFPSYFYVYELCESFVSLRRPSIESATTKMKYDLKHVLVNQYKVWPLINWVSFSLVPENLRVLFSNCASVGWNAFLCSQIGS